MSGAKKKLAQKEAMAQMGLTEKEKKALNEAARKKRNTILGVVGGIILVALVIALLVWDSGSIPRHTTALEINGHKYSVADVTYHYRQTVTTAYNQELYYSQLYQQMAAQGLGDGEYTPSFNLNEDLREQYVDEAKTQSYHDFFMEQTKTQLARYTALADAAKAKGYTLSEEGQTELDEAISSIDDQVRQNGLGSRAAFLRRVYGRTVNESVYRKNVELIALASDYQNTTFAALTDYSDEDLMAYYNEHTAIYNSYDYDYVYFDGTPVLDTDDNGESIPATEEQKTQALADAKEKAENLLKDVKAAQTAVLEEGQTRQSFAQVALTYTTDSTPRPRILGTTIQNSAYFEWLSDSARKDGDTDMFEADGNGYYVIQFHDAYFYNEPTVDVRHILVRAEISEGAEEPTQEQMNAAHDKAEELMKQFNLGEKTAEAFGELAEEHSDDGRNSDGDLNAAGGLYSGIHKGDMVQNFNDWIFDTSRQVGDVGLVENAGPGYYGWHVVYFQATYEPEWIRGTTGSNGARNAKSAEDQNAWMEEVEKGYEATATSALSQISW